MKTICHHSCNEESSVRDCWQGASVYAYAAAISCMTESMAHVFVRKTFLRFTKKPVVDKLTKRGMATFLLISRSLQSGTGFKYLLDFNRLSFDHISCIFNASNVSDCCCTLFVLDWWHSIHCRFSPYPSSSLIEIEHPSIKCAGLSHEIHTRDILQDKLFQ